MTIKKQVLIDYGLNGVICLIYAFMAYAFNLNSWSFVVVLGLYKSVSVAWLKHLEYHYDDEKSQSLKDKAGNKTLELLFFAIVVFFALDCLQLINMLNISITADYRTLLVIYGVLRILYCFYYLMEEKKESKQDQKV